MKARYFAMITTLFLGTSISRAQGDLALRTRLDAVAASWTKNNAFMGTVLVVDGETVLLDKGYGMANLEWDIPNAPDGVFRLGSLTKQFTAALVLLLQQDGKLNIQDPVSKYIPNTPKAWEKITLAKLLSHTAGIPNFTSSKDFNTWSMNPHTPDEELAYFRDKPLEFEPGSKFAYSNSNYEVLGVVVETVSGKKYGDLLRTRIFDPLGMKHSGLDSDTLLLPHRAQGYFPGQTGPTPARSESMSVPWAAGSLYSTTGDLLLWERGLFGGKVLSEASLKAMITAGKGDYGLGVFIREEDGHRIVDHGGGIEGFNTHLTYVPDRKLAIVVLSNINSAVPDTMSGQLMDVAFGRPVTLASEHKAVPIAKGDLAKFVGTFDIAPTFSVNIALVDDGLTAQGTGQPAIPLVYEGAPESHPRFFISLVDAVIEFVPESTGTINSLILHQGGHTSSGKRHVPYRFIVVTPP